MHREIRPNFGEVGGERRLVAVALAFVMVFAATTAWASEKVTVVKDYDTGAYTLASTPSQTSHCAVGNVLYPVTASAMKTFKKKLDPVFPFPLDAEFECQADLYRGTVASSCAAFKLSGCVCTASCGLQF